MKCSNCKLEGYNKNNCPGCKEEKEERFDRLLEILPTETVFVSLAYFSLSRTIQKQGENPTFGEKVKDFLGSTGDLAALNHPNAGIALGGMLSLAYEGAKGDDGGFDFSAFDFSAIDSWLERRGLTKAGFEGLFGGESFVTI